MKEAELTNRFYVVQGLVSYRSQMMLKCGTNKNSGTRSTA